jgi:hypothetical protein
VKKTIDDLIANKTPQNSQLVPVHWADIRTVSRWDDPYEDIRPARKLWTACWLLHDGVDPDEPTEEIVVVAGTWDGEEETWHDITCFPKRAFRRYVSGTDR